LCLDPLSLGLAAAGAPVGGITGFLGSLGFGGLGSVASAAAGGVSAYSAIQQGQAAKEAARATAKMQEESAQQAVQQGEEESDRQRRAGAALMAQQRVAMAANGVDVSSAAAIEQLDDTKGLIEEDAFAIRTGANRSAGGMMQAAANSRTEGNNAASQGLWGGVGSILSTGARVGAKYSQWARQRAGQGSYA